MAFSLHHMLALTAERHPERPAVVVGDATLSYAALLERARKIAALLVHLGVLRGDRVAVYMDRGFDSVAALFGVMQAGAAYVPIDSFAPPGQISSVLRDCDVRIVITEPSKRERLEVVLRDGVPVTTLIGLDPVGLGGPEHISWSAVHAAPDGPPPDVHVIEEDWALIFYTSGSTGRPKGVLHSHRSMISNVDWGVARFRLLPEDRVPHLTSHHFDLSWFELFATLRVGAALVVVPEATVKFPGDLAELAVRQRLTVWCSVPSVLVQLVQRGDLPSRDLARLRWVLFAGERFPTKHLRSLMSMLPRARFCNMYGTTETHIAACYDVPPLPAGSDEPIPIGRACDHVNLMAVDPEGKPVGVNETGQLVVRGPSLMEGYWRRPELTEKALVRLSFSPSVSGLCYHTGDLVTLRPDGHYHIEGRADRRVKIRGHLIDLDEIEKALLSHPDVDEASAFLAPAGNDLFRLDAAVVPRSRALTALELRSALARFLPSHGIPERITIVESFPRTGSGKTSRNDLRAQLQATVELATPTGGEPSDALRTFVLDLAGIGELGEDDDLLVSGLLDSVGVASIASFIERHFGLRVPDAEFAEANFGRLASIRRLVERLSSAAGEASGTLDRMGGT
jgi:amino acid adenylation domain-containing protein